MKKFILLTLVIVALSSCSGIESRRDTELKLIMTTYHRAWVDGANASTEAGNMNQPFDSKIGQEKLSKDSLAFLGELNWYK